MDFTDIIIAGKVSEIDMTTLSLDDINLLIRQITDHNNMQKLIGAYLENQLEQNNEK